MMETSLNGFLGFDGYIINIRHDLDDSGISVDLDGNVTVGIKVGCCLIVRVWWWLRINVCVFFFADLLVFGSGDAFKWWMVGFGLLVGMVCGVAYSVCLRRQ